MWIRVYPTGKTNFNSKNGRKRSFYYETKASLSIIPMKRICLWFLIMKTSRLLHGSVFITIDIRTMILKNGGKWGFSYETKDQFIYPYEENEFRVPNHWKKAYCYVNLCLSKLKDNF